MNLFSHLVILFDPQIILGLVFEKYCGSRKCLPKTQNLHGLAKVMGNKSHKWQEMPVEPEAGHSPSTGSAAKCHRTTAQASAHSDFCLREKGNWGVQRLEGFPQIGEGWGGRESP